MTADIVNLRQARKRKARVEKEARSLQNRIVFGRSKAESRHGAASKQLQDKKLEGHRLTPTPTREPRDSD
jgi:hypothetical protein